MADYVLGVIFGILGGMCNFLGQVVQKKAINDTAFANQDKALVKSLVRNKTWLIGMISGNALSAVFVILGQANVGAALIPGLAASGFIVLAIGSTKILKESLKLVEYMAIVLLMVAITLIGLSQLSIAGSIDYFYDAQFDTRIAIHTIGFVGLWLGLFYGGRKATRFKSIMLAMGTGFPFVLGNLWLQPVIVSIGPVFSGTADGLVWCIFLISGGISAVSGIFGIGHYQYALNSGNASIVVPVQQIPQQIAPILIYSFIYQLAPVAEYSLSFMLIGIALICIAGFVLGNRQATLEKIKVPGIKNKGSG